MSDEGIRAEDIIMNERVERAKELTEELRNEYNKMFSMFDMRTDGSISQRSTGRAIRLLGYNPSEDELKRIISSRCEAEEDVTFLVFLDIMLEILRTTEPPNELKYAFDVLDTDRQGHIEVATLQRLLQELGEPLSTPEVDRFVDALNVSVGGHVEFEDIKRIFDNSVA